MVKYAIVSRRGGGMPARLLTILSGRSERATVRQAHGALSYTAIRQAHDVLSYIEGRRVKDLRVYQNYEAGTCNDYYANLRTKCEK